VSGDDEEEDTDPGTDPGFADEIAGVTRAPSSVDVLIVGGGPAGLEAARALRGIHPYRVLVIDREPMLGGVPRHARHAGYGLGDLGRPMLGPEYARHRVALAAEAGAELRPESSAVGFMGMTGMRVVSPSGIDDVRARAILLATGCRERPRSARLVPGTRPAGVYTTGSLQQLVHLHGVKPGKRAVVVGGEPVSFSAVRTLLGAGVEIAAMVTHEPRARALPWLASSRPIAIDTESRLSRIDGARRVESVVITNGASSRTVACDTVVFTGDFVPEHELARRAGLSLDRQTGSPTVGAGFMTSRPGVFAAGGLVRAGGSAYACAQMGNAAAWAVHRFLTRS
jgi:thioredoxin reductase